MKSNLIKIFIGRKKEGFTLIEAIIAIFLLIVGIIATYSLVVFSISSMSYASNKFIAAYLAQEGIELVRNIRDTNWLEGGGTDWKQGIMCGGTFDENNNGCIVDFEDVETFNIDLSDSPYDSGQTLNINGDGWFSNDTSLNTTKFKRKISTDDSIYNILKVYVRVEWTEKGKTFYIAVSENLYDWN